MFRNVNTDGDEQHLQNDLDKLAKKIKANHREEWMEFFQNY